MKNFINNLKINKFRNIVQVVFSLYLLTLGIGLYRFANYFAQPGVANIAGAPTRSPGVEGFLPIYALMSLKGWLSTGIFDTLHPAALVIFIAVLATAFLARKSFCSWLCPIGAISEGVGKIGDLIFKKKYNLPKYLHYPLLAVKYLLFTFFAFSILVFLPGKQIPVMIKMDPYYWISDIKLMQFFLGISGTGLIVIGILILLSLFIRNFWCRYLCPYGALLGIASVISPIGVKRDQDLCISCGKCNHACNNGIDVMKSKQIYTPECTGCMNCVAVCPKKDALTVKAAGRFKVDGWYYVLIILGVFFGIILLAQLTGHWTTGVSLGDYSKLIPDASKITH